MSILWWILSCMLSFQCSTLPHHSDCAIIKFHFSIVFMEVVLIENEVQIEQDKQSRILKQAEQGYLIHLSASPDNPSPYQGICSTRLIVSDTLCGMLSHLRDFLRQCVTILREFAPLEKTSTDKLSTLPIDIFNKYRQFWGWKMWLTARAVLFFRLFLNFCSFHFW